MAFSAQTGLSALDTSAAPYTRVKAMIAEFANDKKDGSIFLPEAQRTGIMTYITEKSLIEELGSAVPISDVAEGTVVLNKDIEARLQTKKGMGQYGTDGSELGQFDNALVNPIAIPFMTGKVIRQGLTAVDISRGLSFTLADKAPKYMDVIRKDYERTGWAEVVKLDGAPTKVLGAAGAPANTNKVTTLTGMDRDKARILKNQIVNQATLMTLTRDPLQGIDLIDRERISIYMNPIAFDALIDAGLVGNRATASFEGGQYSIGSLGGYRIVANPFLVGTTAETAAAGDVVALIATNFVFFSRMKFVAYNSGNLDNLSNDQGTYIETKYARGVVFNNKAAAGNLKDQLDIVGHKGSEAQSTPDRVPTVAAEAIKFVSVVAMAEA